MPKITQAFYTSVSTFGPRNSTDQDILHVSRERNARNMVTGFLFRTNTHFLQILEGERRAVLSILESIRKDPRHYNLREWPLQETDARIFDEWSMGYGRTERDDMFSFALGHAEPKSIGELVPRLRTLSLDLTEAV